MMTEAQAKERWCPFARSLAIGGAANAVAAVNIATVKGEEYRPPCIASACMAWRWDNKQGLFNLTEGHWQEPGTVYADSDVMQERIRHADPKVGRCGLAGAE